jgi:hypothetical protein
VSEAGGAGRLARTLEVVGVLVAPTSLLTGLLYYFAKVRENALFGYFDVSASMVEFSVQDYLVRGVRVVSPFLACVVVAGLAALVAHVGLLAAAETPVARRHHRRVVATVTAVLAVTAALLLAGGLSQLARARIQPRTALLAAAALSAGAFLAEYAFLAPGHLRARARPPARPAPPSPRLVDPLAPRPGQPCQPVQAYQPVQPRGPALLGRRLIAVRRLLVGALLLVAVFWATTVVANAHGTAAARTIVRNLPFERGAVVYSAQRLQITGRGVSQTALGRDPTLYRFRYTGLHLLARSNGRLFLLPRGWRHGGDSAVIVLPDDPVVVRLDFLSCVPRPPRAGSDAAAAHC